MQTKLSSMLRAVLIGGAAAIAAIAAPALGTAVGEQFPREGWRATIKAADASRLDGLAEAWEVGLAQARRAGFERQMRSYGDLLRPDAALPNAYPPVGEYRCRVIKVGSLLAARGQTGGMLALNPAPFFRCSIRESLANPIPGWSERQRIFTKLTGSQRHRGRLFRDSDQRAVFVGTLALGDERAWPGYTVADERDAAGIIERVGPKRWRLVLPWPRYDSVIDVVEFVPA